MPAAIPNSTVGRCLTTAANASIAMQPVTGLATMVVQATHHYLTPQETATVAGSTEECIPADPQPVAPEPAVEVVEGVVLDGPVQQVEQGPDPIVINEEEPASRVEEAEPPSSTIDLPGLPDGICPMVMPYCTDDEPMSKPSMPYADSEAEKPAAGGDESDDKVFKAWMNLFEASGRESKSEPAEQLPAPTEEPSIRSDEPQAEPKCQEDSHLHEHYSGCPHTYCPYTGKSYPSDTAATKSGKEENSEEPAPAPKKHGKKGKDKETCPHTEGVDTMEYRPSDGGLHEYGPSPLH